MIWYDMIWYDMMWYMIWYDMIWYMCLLQFGWHPVAVVQYTFTHKQCVITAYVKGYTCRPPDMNRFANLRNCNLHNLWTAKLLQTNFVISAGSLCTYFNAFNNQSIFLYMWYWCSVNPCRWSKQIETCRSYDILCVKSVILTIFF